MLTKKQLDLLEFISKRVARDGVPPSFDEMKEALDLRDFACIGPPGCVRKYDNVGFKPFCAQHTKKKLKYPRKCWRSLALTAARLRYDATS